MAVRRQCRCAALALLAGLSATSAHAGADLDGLLDGLETIRGDSGVPAFAFTLVSSDETLYAGAHGLADLATARRATPATVFRIGSITKTFTALTLLLAVDDGLLGLDEHLDDVAGGRLVDNPWSACAPVTLAQLLEHTAGLAELSREEMDHSDPASVPLAAAVRRYAQERQVRWRPGEYYSYTNAGAGLVAYALQRRSGMRWDALLAERLLAPLGMRDTTIVPDERGARRRATGYDRDGTTPIPYWHMLYRPFGAIDATAGDMAAFLRLLLNHGRHGARHLLSKAAVMRMEQPRTSLAARRGLDFGYGAGLYTWYHRGHLFHGHGGDGDGYLAHFGYNRAAGRAYFIVINAFKHAPLRRMRTLIEDYIVAPLPAAAIAPILAMPAGTGRLAGHYRRAARRFPSHADADTVLTLSFDDGRLLSRAARGAPRALLPVAPGLWRRGDEPAATIALIRNAGGARTWHGERMSLIRDDAPAAAERLACRP